LARRAVARSPSTFSKQPETTLENIKDINPESITTEWRDVDTEEATLTLADEVPTVTGDTGQLTQLFENLFRNAVEHGGADVTVTVGRLGEDDGVYVADPSSVIPQARRSVQARRHVQRGGPGSGTRS
jgi:signal transduction histidine kinase